MPRGRTIAVGGKTGTGDNRLESFAANGRVIGDKVVSRTATFVFMIGDRFYGTIVAYVPGPTAASYKFTSALAVQIFKDLEPQLRTLITQPDSPPPLLPALLTKNERPNPASSIQR